MNEIFSDIPEEVRIRTKLFFELAFSQPYPRDVIQMLKEYRDTCIDEYERDFVDFYFNMRMTQISNEEGE